MSDESTCIVASYLAGRLSHSTRPLPLGHLALVCMHAVQGQPVHFQGLEQPVHIHFGFMPDHLASMPEQADQGQSIQIKASVTCLKPHSTLHHAPASGLVMCGAVLWWAILSCAVLHCVVLCCVVLCCVVLCCVVLCCVVLCCVVLCCVVLCCVVPKALLPQGNGRDVYPRVQVNGRAVCIARAMCKCVDIGGERGVGETWRPPTRQLLST